MTPGTMESALETLAQAVLDGRVWLETRREYGPDGPVTTTINVHPKREEPCPP